jgi:hypothetical protein
MKRLHQNFRFAFATLLLICSGFGPSSAADARSSAERFAKMEFFHLMRSGEWINYIENGTYVEVEGTQFIGLQAAFNTRRTCLYGFSQAGLGSPGSFQVETRFVCFQTKRYELKLQKEWCEIGSQSCGIDPGGISVGIGNLNVVEPVGVGRPYPDTFPKLLNVDVYEFPRPGIPELN